MSLSDLASLGSFVSGIAVAVTLVFLLLQMRQSDRNQRAAIRMGRATRANDLYAMMIDPDVARVLAKAWRCEEDLSEVEANIYLAYCTAMLTNFEDTYFQYGAGLLDKAVWEGEEAIIRLFVSRPSFRAMWQFNQIFYGKEFRGYVEKLLGQVTVFRPDALAPSYKTALHEQLAQAKPASPENVKSDLGLDSGKTGMRLASLPAQTGAG